MRFLAAIGALAIIVAIGAAVFFFGGFFNVAASEQDLQPVAWALQKVRTASIEPACQGHADRLARRRRRRAGRRQGLRRARLRQLPRRARRRLGQVLRRPAARSARPQGRRRRARAARALLRHQERHQHDGHAELRRGSRWAIPKSGRSSPSSRSCRRCRKPTTRAGPKPRRMHPPRAPAEKK